jgi:hypothetical protein
LSIPFDFHPPRMSPVLKLMGVSVDEGRRCTLRASDRKNGSEKSFQVVR